MTSAAVYGPWDFGLSNHQCSAQTIGLKCDHRVIEFLGVCSFTLSFFLLQYIFVYLLFIVRLYDVHSFGNVTNMSYDAIVGGERSKIRPFYTEISSTSKLTFSCNQYN